MVPEPKNAKSGPCQILRAFEILEYSLRMLAAIEFDH
jgi:hypothetical protein